MKNSKTLMDLEWQNPMLATLTHEYFNSPTWIYECKMDGERCIAYCDDAGKIVIYSRNKQVLNNTFPEIIESLMPNKDKSFIIDGEIVALDKNGVTKFSLLQNRIGISNATKQDLKNTPVYYYVFDILYLNKENLKSKELMERKEILKDNIKFASNVIYTEHIREDGLKYLNEACKKNWEGIIAKNGKSHYENRRSKNWLKFKCWNEQEFIIIGYTQPKGTRIGFGAILIGFYKGKELHYAGKVGTGFDTAMLKALKDRFSELEEEKPTIVSKEIKEKNIHWLKPQLVCEISFTEWTKNNKLRHPRFIGIRLDKNPKEVGKEFPNDS